MSVSGEPVGAALCGRPGILIDSCFEGSLVGHEGSPAGRCLRSYIKRESVASYDHLAGISGFEFGLQSRFINGKIEMGNHQLRSARLTRQAGSFTYRQVRRSLARLTE